MDAALRRPEQGVDGERGGGGQRQRRGADLRYVGTACPRTPWSDADRQWLEARGVHVQYRASLEQDLAAMHEFQPDLAIGTTPVVQAAKQASVPALYFTNLISARPLMGPAGAGSLAQVVNTAIANKGRFEAMRELIAYLLEDCCQGSAEVCTPLAGLLASQAACCGPAPKETTHEAPARSRRR